MINPFLMVYDFVAWTFQNIENLYNAITQPIVNLLPFDDAVKTAITAVLGVLNIPNISLFNIMTSFLVVLIVLRFLDKLPGL